MATSSIEWTDRVWNPTVGCSKVSAGCKHCYAETMHARLTGMGQAKYAEPFTVVKPWPAQLADPLKWKKPAHIFVNSMSDLFHEDVPDEYIAAVFGVMAACPQHTFQVLTKRAERMAKWFRWLDGEGSNGYHIIAVDTAANNLLDEAGRELQDRGTDDGRNTNPSTWPVWPLKNVWLGVSVENQEQADRRIPKLLEADAAVRFLSCEPLLERVDLERIDATKAGWRSVNGFPAPTAISAFAEWQDKPMRAKLKDGIDWCIVGGESGHGARPCSLEWVESIASQCRAAEVPVFVKQLGAFPLPRHPGDIMGRRIKQYVNGLEQRVCIAFDDKKGGDMSEWPAELRVREFPAVRQ